MACSDYAGPHNLWRQVFDTSLSHRHPRPPSASSTPPTTRSFFVRHAYFLGDNDPYKSLKTALRAEIDEAAWATLNSDVSRPFPRPKHGRVAVKVINHFGDEVMKVFTV